MVLKLTVLLFITGVLAVSTYGEEVLSEINLEGSTYDDISEDASLDVIGLLTKYGYPSETHEVETEDGYLLTMHRITGGKGVSRADKPVVFLMHGLLCSSADWLTGGTEIGLGYYLADMGFDVWMGNARGTFYSRKHISLSPEESAFWKFTWNQIGMHDLPAMIDRVLEETGREKIHYIGHSQGTTVFFVMASMLPEYNDKILSMQALAPVGYMSNLKSPIVRFLASFENTIQIVTSLFGINEMLPNTEMMTIAGDLMCKDDALLQPVCTNFLFLLCGNNPELFNTTILPVIFGHTPAGAATKQIIHFVQEYNSAKFRKYDFGVVGNLLEYGQLVPPAYPLKQVSAPVALHYAANDYLSHPDDVHQLYTELGNPIGKFLIPHPKFNHLDYLWALNVRTLLYDRVVNLMHAFDKNSP